MGESERSTNRFVLSLSKDGRKHTSLKPLVPAGG